MVSCYDKTVVNVVAYVTPG